MQAQTAANAALAAIAAAQPKNEIEAMLASQMAATHALVMDLMGRTKRAQYQPQFEMAGNMAVKLMGTFTAQTEALAKLRRGGEQTVRVEHVHVHPGGQAVVGTVATGVGGGRENGGRAHAPEALGNASGAPVWSADAERDAVPVAGNGQGMHGGAKGSGGPAGARNGNYRHGEYTREAIAERRLLRAWVRYAARSVRISW